MKFILTLLFITIFLGFVFLQNIEKYSQAAYIQLVAKGPQDAYLSADAVNISHQYITQVMVDMDHIIHGIDLLD